VAGENWWKNGTGGKIGGKWYRELKWLKLVQGVKIVKKR